MGWFRRTSADGDGDMPSLEDRLAQIGPGVPGHCPSCDGLGYIDSIDIGHRYQIQHCKACLHRWEYLFDEDGTVVGLTELDADGRPVARSRVRPVRTTAPADDRATDAPAPVDEAAPVDDGAPADEPAHVDALPDIVVDLRDPVTAGDPLGDLREPVALSPAEWLRQSARR